MAGQAFTARVERRRPGPLATAGLVTLVAVQGLLLAIYLTSPAAGAVGDPATYVFTLLQPFVWIDLGLLAVLTTEPPPAGTRRRRVAIAIAVGYFLVLGFFGGLLGVGGGTGLAGVNWTLTPGYSPRLFYDGSVLALTLEPYKLVGYAALAYLIFVTLLDAAGAAFSGLIGLLSCVSCSWPIIGTVVAGILGGSSTLATTALTQAYPLSTLVFVSAVALLWWRPGLDGG